MAAVTHAPVTPLAYGDHAPGIRDDHSGQMDPKSIEVVVLKVREVHGDLGARQFPSLSAVRPNDRHEHRIGITSAGIEVGRHAVGVQSVSSAFGLLGQAFLGGNLRRRCFALPVIRRRLGQRVALAGKEHIHVLEEWGGHPASHFLAERTIPRIRTSRRANCRTLDPPPLAPRILTITRGQRRRAAGYRLTRPASRSALYLAI